MEKGGCEEEMWTDEDTIVGEDPLWDLVDEILELEDIPKELLNKISKMLGECGCDGGRTAGII